EDVCLLAARSFGRDKSFGSDKRVRMLALGDETNVREFRRAVNKNDVGRFDVPMHEPALMQMFQALAKSHSHLDALLDIETFRTSEGFSQRLWNILFRVNRLSLLQIVRGLHYIVEATDIFIPANLQNIHKAFVRARDRFEFLDPEHLPFE